jgi:amino acid adenylation domain-containing protein
MDINSKNIGGLIAGIAAKFPDKIAIKHNGNTITYRELDICSNQLAAYFLDNGIAPGDIVAVVTDRSIKLIACLLAIIKAGAAYLPVDPNLPADRVNFMLEDCGAAVLCTSQQYERNFGNRQHKVIIDEAWIKRYNYSPDDPGVKYNPDTLAYILYTSGSTGKPKGVAIEQHSLVNLLLSVQRSPGMNADDIILGITTISFDIAELEMFLPLVSGAQLIIVDSEVARDGRALLDIIQTERVSIMQATPFTWRMIMQSGWNKRLPLKAFCGGEAMGKDLAERLLERCDELWNMYGPTETTIYSTIKKVTLKDKVITIGKPISKTEVYILDEEKQVVPDGEEGEIYIGGEGVARGYINRPELNDERFIDDTFSGRPGKKIYKTGDWGKLLPNGEIQYLGRIDHQIKIRGYRIETEEIEYLLKQRRSIREALIVLHEDELGNKQLIAYVVPKARITRYQQEVSVKRWKEYLKRKLPAYMVPNAFVLLPKMPLTANGKVDRKKLPLPTIKRRRKLLSKTKQPKTDTEKLLCEIVIKNTGWAKLGLNDNLIDMGIDSLVALMIIVDIEEAFDKRLPITVLVHHPTIKMLAAFINSISSSPYNSLLPLKAEGSKVPLYVVHGIGLNLFNFTGMISQLDPEQPVYGIRAAGLDGNFSPLGSIEEVSAYYNQEILNHDPIGPYAIAGYSFGGIIAYEMVKQLKQAGKKVEMLAMIDTNLQDEMRGASDMDKLKRKFTRQFAKLKFRAGSLLKAPWHNILYLKDVYGHKLKRLLGKTGLLNRYRLAEMPEYMQKVVNKFEEAWQQYKLQPFDIRIDLFRAKDRIYYVDDPEYLGWGDYALGGVVVHEVPGDHKEMFYPPNDTIMARSFQKRLNTIPQNFAQTEVQKNIA